MFLKLIKTEYQITTKSTLRIVAILIAGISSFSCLTGCTVNVRGRQRPLVKVDDISGQLDLSYDTQTDKSENSGIKTESESTIMEERLSLNARGDVFDPRFVSYMALLGFGLNQQEFQTTTNSGSSSGTLNSYGLRANFLPLKPYPFSIEANQTDNLVARSYQGPLHVKNSNEGVSLRLKVPEWPMTFSYSNSETQQNSDVASNESDFNRTSEKFSYTLLHDFNDNSKLTFRSDIDSLSQSTQQFINNLDTQRHRLLHDLNFGDYKQHRLNSTLSLLERVDQFKSTSLEWSENLTLKHSDSFLTYYNALVTENKLDSVKNRSLAGTVGFNHRLYDNLNTNASIFGTKSDFGGVNTTDTFGGRIRFGYTRNNPLGILRIDLELESSERESSGETGTTLVVDEAQSFTDPGSFFLNQRNVNIDTIIITNSDGTAIYTEGDDYSVSVVGDRVEIEPTTLGSVFPNIPSIAGAQTLLVDYTYNIEGDRQEDYRRDYFKIQQDFSNGISAYFSNRSYERLINSTVDPDAADEYSDMAVFGLRYKTKYLTLRAEHANTDSTYQSTESDRLSATMFWPVTPKTSLIGSVSQAWIDAVGQNARETEVFKAEGKVRTRVTRNLRLTGKAEYRDEYSTGIGQTEGLRFGAFVDYNRASFNLRAEWNIYSLDRQNTSRDSTGFFVKLTRRF